MAKKNVREKIRLVSSEGTGHFYTTTKNKRNMPEKMEIKKFDPVARKHCNYNFKMRLFRASSDKMRIFKSYFEVKVLF